jgi:hypothetical protein
VREVDQHSESIHLAHDLFAERRQAMMSRVVGGRIGPRGIGGMGERQVARPGVIVGTQHGERIVDLVASFDADQRGDEMRAVQPDDVGGAVGHGKIVRVARTHRLHQVDLLERLLHRLRARDLHRDEHRPELRPDAAAAQARNVGHQRWAALGRGQCHRVDAEIDLRQVAAEALTDLPRQVVVAVDERCLDEHPVDARIDRLGHIRAPRRGR